MQLSAPWEILGEPELKQAIVIELQKEVAAHSAELYRQANVLARRVDQDDFLFETSDAQWPYAIVHLTFNGKAEAQPWPKMKLFKNLEAVMAVVVQDVADYQQ